MFGSLFLDRTSHLVSDKQKAAARRLFCCLEAGFGRQHFLTCAGSGLRAHRNDVGGMPLAAQRPGFSNGIVARLRACRCSAKRRHTPWACPGAPGYFAMSVGWWRGLDSNQCSLRRQIYSLMDLTTLPPLHIFPGRKRTRFVFVGAVYGGLSQRCQLPCAYLPQEIVQSAVFMLAVHSAPLPCRRQSC